MAIASERAIFAKPEINLGFPPTFGGTQRLARLVGRKRSLAMILTAEPSTAVTAREIGLVNRVVPPGKLLADAFMMAATISGKSRQAVAACLASVTRGLNVSIHEGLAIEASQFGLVVGSQDVREGIQAFIEKRRPVFRGV